MAYKLRFVQRFAEENRDEFIRLEKEFIKLEQQVPQFPKGKRFLPYIGREPGNTLIWECEFEELNQAFSALKFLEDNPRHEELYTVQSKYFLEAYTEIYYTLEG